GPQGTVSIPAPTGRGWLVVAKADGFRSTELSLDESASGTITLRLAPTRRTRGRVVDGAGQPVSLAKVVAVVAEPLRRSFYDTEDVATTNEKGEFELRHVPAGMQVSFVVAAPDRLPQPSRMFTFSSADASDSEFDLVATPEAASTVRGVVLDANGRPAGGATLNVSLGPAYLSRFGAAGSRALTLAGVVEPMVKTSPEGTFEIRGLPAGELTLRARLPGFVSRPERVSVTPDRAADVRLTLSPARVAAKPAVP
ncbi:MAG: carboxypeptidase-like regulatory domain-containing protein, partial [Acidobacteriota bacterium]